MKHSQAVNNQNPETHLWLLDINYERYQCDKFQIANQRIVSLIKLF